MDMNSYDVLQWLKSFIDDENIIKVFEGKLSCFFFFEMIFMHKNTHVSQVKLSVGLVSGCFIL